MKEDLTHEELIARIHDIEWDDFEAKAARTELPKATWPTVSSFSNTSGGWILFGVAQTGKKFELEGVENPEKIESDFLTTVRSKDKFNHTLSVAGKKIDIDGKHILAFFVPSSDLKPIWFGNPKNTFIRTGSGDQRATDQSAPRNPTILKLFRYTKISDNAGYGMDKIYSWERLTGEKVDIETNTMCTDVTFWRPRIGSSIRRKDTTPVTAPATTPAFTPQKKRTERKRIREKIFRIIKSSPTLSKEEIGYLCGLKKEGVRYHIDKLRDEKGLHWEGNSLNGRWVWDQEARGRPE